MTYLQFRIGGSIQWLGDPVKALLLSFHLRIRAFRCDTRRGSYQGNNWDRVRGGEWNSNFQGGQVKRGGEKQMGAVLEDQNGNRDGLPGR